MSLKKILELETTNKEVAREIYEQITVCRDLGKPLSLAKIGELCKLANPTQVQIALHDYKLA